MEMPKALDIALGYLEMNPKSFKQILVEYAKDSDNPDSGMWCFIFLPEGLENPNLSDLIKVKIEEKTGYVSTTSIV